MTTSLPRQYARTRRFTLGAPRSFTIAPDGSRVLFLRSRAGDDPVTGLWELDVASGAERLIADPAAFGGGEEPTPDERTQRERLRELASGITRYATDRAARLAAFALSGRLCIADVEAASVRELPAMSRVADPRPDPAGSVIAYVAGGELRVIGTDGSGDRRLAAPGGPDVSYGLPEHVAAESMGRYRGYWWAPDGSALLAARVDVAPVRRWYIADPANPGTPPAEIAYPVAGTANADVSLWVIALDGSRVAVDWDRARFEYLTAAAWAERELLIVVQSRSQRALRVLAVDPLTGATRVRREDTDPCWVQIVPGAPAVTETGSLAWVADIGGSRRLVVDDAAVTRDGLNVREITATDGETVLFTASAEPTQIGLWAYSPRQGVTAVADSPGVHRGWRAGETTVVVSESLGHHGQRVTVRRNDQPAAQIASCAETPVLTPRVRLLRAAGRELRTAVLLPSWHQPGSRSLPVLMDPYGGPGGQRVLAARGSYLVSQWFADQGFAVVVADGRGTPGRGPAWEREIHGDLAGPVLEDQVSALHAAAAGWARRRSGCTGRRPPVPRPGGRGGAPSSACRTTGGR